MKCQLVSIALLWIGMTLLALAQANENEASTVQVPHLIPFTGSVNAQQTSSDPVSEEASGIVASGATRSAERSQRVAGGAVTLTFTLYTQQTGGEPLWQETHEVRPDSTGRYTVLLGSSASEGLPLDLFASSRSHWLEVVELGRPKPPRVMLSSVPYALKAADIETLGGKPPSAYAKVSEADGDPRASRGNGQNQGGPSRLSPISGSGATNYVPLWSNSSALSNSLMYQSPAGNIGIKETQPMAKLQFGNASPGLEGTTTMATGKGISGNANVSSTTAFGVLGSTGSSTGNGVNGAATSTTGTNYGVYGSTGSDAEAVPAVIGAASSTTGTSAGVQGQSQSPSGIAGTFQNTATSETAVGMGALSLSDQGGFAVEGIGITGAVTAIVAQACGVAGSTNQDGGVGVMGTADDAIAVRGRNNRALSQLATADFDNVQNRSQIAPVLIARSHEFDGFCELDVSGDINCNGSLSAAVPVDSNSRRVALYAEESPENWFEDAGSAQLNHGAATVALEPIFAQTVNTGVEYHVFLTPTGDCNGVYVSSKGATSFEVHEVGSGTSSIGFEYRIVGRRKGYESVRLADRTEQFDSVAFQNKRRRQASPGAPRSIDQLFRNPPWLNYGSLFSSVAHGPDTTSIGGK